MPDSPPSILHEKALIEEKPFESNTPFIGRFLATFRTRWNNVAARWYVQEIYRQQTDFNLLAAQHVKELQAQLQAQDEEIVALTRTIAELEIEVKRLKQQTD